MLLKLVAAGAAGYALYRYANRNSQSTTPSAAFAVGESTEGFAPVRNAGPESMASDLPRWDKVDQAADESFPASDPPSAGKFT